MVEISHRKAQVFLQISADDMLSAENQALLNAHLTKCDQCREYAKKLKSLENRLQKSSHTHWDNFQPRLNLSAITNPPTKKIIWNYLVGLNQGMGRVTIVAALVVGYFLITNLSGNQISSSGNETPTVLPTPNEFSFSAATSPTPSAQLTLTGLLTQACNPIIHVVQTADSLDSIAIQYKIPKVTLMDYNNLVADKVSPGTNLNIPMCDSTPSHTASTPTNTITVTPLGSLFFPTQPD